MLRAVIFDFDGVIADSEALHLRAFNVVLRPFGVVISTEAYYRDYLGLTDFECFTQVVAGRRLGLDEAAVRDLVARKNRVFKEFAATEGQIIDGVVPFLNMLGAASIPMAICSGAKRIEIGQILDQAGLNGYFETIVAADDVAKGKPDPQGFLLALDRLNEGRHPPITAAQCVAIEDSRWGLSAAQAAGMKTIAVTNSYDAAELTAADLVVDRLDALTLDHLHGLCTTA